VRRGCGEVGERWERWWRWETDRERDKGKKIFNKKRKTRRKKKLPLLLTSPRSPPGRATAPAATRARTTGGGSSSTTPAWTAPGTGRAGGWLREGGRGKRGRGRGKARASEEGGRKTTARESPLSKKKEKKREKRKKLFSLFPHHCRVEDFACVLHFGVLRVLSEGGRG